jgi:hypothetical protein
MTSRRTSTSLMGASADVATWWIVDPQKLVRFPWPVNGPISTPTLGCWPGVDLEEVGSDRATYPSDVGATATALPTTGREGRRE